MRAAGGGVICNITSSSTLAPVPFLGAYRASKAAVSAIGESLAAEVAQFGIRVVEVMPGPIETDMLASSDRPAPAIEHEQYRALAEKMWEGRQAVRESYTPAPEAARRIADAILDDDGPLRYGCDDLSEGMLAGWEAPTTRSWVGGMLRVVQRMITGLAHTALHVADVDAAVAWYARRARPHRAVAAVPHGRRRDRARHGRAAARSGRREGRDRRRRRRIRSRHRGHRVSGGRSGDRRRRPTITRPGFTHVALLCDDVAATRRDLEAKGVRFLVDGIADVAGLRTTWFADPWQNVFILVEKVRRPDRAYYRQYIVSVTLSTCRGQEQPVRGEHDFGVLPLGGTVVEAIKPMRCSRRKSPKTKA